MGFPLLLLALPFPAPCPGTGVKRNPTLAHSFPVGQNQGQGLPPLSQQEGVCQGSYCPL